MTATATWPKGLGHGTGVVKTDSCPKGGWCLVMLGWVGGQCSPCTLPSSGGMCPVLSTQQEAQSCGCIWDGSSGRTQEEGVFAFVPQTQGCGRAKFPSWDLGCQDIWEEAWLQNWAPMFEQVFTEYLQSWIGSQFRQLGLCFLLFFFSPEIAKGTHLTPKTYCQIPSSSS